MRIHIRQEFSEVNIFSKPQVAAMFGGVINAKKRLVLTTLWTTSDSIIQDMPLILKLFHEIDGLDIKGEGGEGDGDGEGEGEVFDSGMQSKDNQSSNGSELKSSMGYGRRSGNCPV